jgi:hypothetical protein
MRHRRIVMAVVLMAIVAGACSKKAGPATGIVEASGGERTAIESVLTAHYAADTPQKVCATITRGYELTIKHLGGVPPSGELGQAFTASPQCPKVIQDAVKRGDFDLTPMQVTVPKVLVQDHKAAALVQEPTQRRRYFLAQGPEGWLIANVTTPPPDFRDLGQAIGT